ncbi:hypothetical protein [Streptomyces sparsogenes]|uniref:Uncharacterized protein n=1 Tax=Streptomyces sparsogenes DSM 40356 TaxID=1331668 RepID=A0A1R1SIK5_9ACTN|nr:hypothetical protein [Streptomyces sparsogenes]OMI38130.1 hypothetical protein SPAR_17905 [Streptomyces sparsogenes DSM 40356]
MASAEPPPSGFAVLCAYLFALGREGGEPGEDPGDGPPPGERRALLLRAATAVVASLAICAAALLDIGSP